MLLREIRPGIDGLTLVKRTYEGRPKRYSQYFTNNSPLNVEIDLWGKATNRNIKQILMRKLSVCGQFSFICEKSNIKHEKSTLKLYNHQVVNFDCPDRFHLPKFLAEHKLMNYEPISQACFLAAAEIIGRPVFDIGSNIGVYSMAVASALRLPVYAFEPFCEAADVLHNIATNYDLPIKVITKGVGDNVGVKRFYISTKSDMSNSLNPSFRAHREIRDINVTTIDQYSSIVKPGAIKIDVETTELQVLQGGLETLKRDQPVLLIEVLTDNIADSIVSIFKPMDYRIIQLGDASFQDNMGEVSDLDRTGDERNWLIVPSTMDINEKFFMRAKHHLNTLRDIS